MNRDRLRSQGGLSREEVNSLIEAAPTPFQRTLLMALYHRTPARRTARLKITDTDSACNVICAGRQGLEGSRCHAHSESP
jgi:hypothetical protein